MEEQKEKKAATKKDLLLDGWYGSLESERILRLIDDFQTTFP